MNFIMPTRVHYQYIEKSKSHPLSIQFFILYRFICLWNIKNYFTIYSANINIYIYIIVCRFLIWLLSIITFNKITYKYFWYHLSRGTYISKLINFWQRIALFVEQLSDRYVRYNMSISHDFSYHSSENFPMESLHAQSYR